MYQVNQQASYKIQAVIRVAKYLYGTIRLGLTFTSYDSIDLYAFVDALYYIQADIKGHTGIYFTISTDNASFQFITKKDKFVVRSSTKAEFEAIDSCIVQVEMLRSMIEFFKYKPTSPTTMF